MSKKTMMPLEENTKVEREYKTRKVLPYVYRQMRDLPDIEARDQLAQTALDLLTRDPEPGENESMLRATGERMLFALAQLQIEELEATESRAEKGQARALVNGRASTAIDTARDRSYIEVYGKVRPLWSGLQKRSYLANLDRPFQRLLLGVGIRGRTITPGLRKAAKNAVVTAKRQGLDIFDVDLRGSFEG